MKVEIAKAIVEAIEDANPGAEAHVYDDYSGRGMYGKTTAGVVVPNWAIWSQGVAEAMHRIIQENEASTATDRDEQPMDPSDFTRAMGDIKWDNMGRSVIIY